MKRLIQSALPTTRMSENKRIEKEIDELRAQIQADRMAAGLSCIPHPVKGDLDTILALKETIRQIAKLAPNEKFLHHGYVIRKF